MKHKETLMEKIIKRFYGISGVLDEYRLQEIRRIGNNAFMFLFWYILLSNFIVLHLVDRLDSETILLNFCLINIAVLILGVGGYLLYQVSKLKLSKIEVADNQRGSIKKKYALRCAFSGIVFGALGTMLSIFDSKGKYLNQLISFHSLASFLFDAFLFGGMTYLLACHRLKKESEEE